MTQETGSPARCFQPYPVYKDFGVEWLDQTPEHWSIARVSEQAELINGYPFQSELFHLSDGIPLVRIRDLESENTEVFYNGPAIPSALIDTGDILIGMDGEFNVAAWRGGSALLNQRLCCLRPRTTIDDRFLTYSLPFPLRVINDLTYSTTVKHLSSNDVQKLRVPYPPLLEQRAIAAFLDRETAKIDALVAKKERLIELLEEKRAALITQAVTRGLDPNVPMKDSGVRWIGAIPKHWEVLRTKFVARLESGHTPSRQHPEYWLDCTVPWFTLADVWQLRDGRVEYVSETAERVSEVGLANSAAQKLPKATVILSRTASVGFSAIMGTEMATTQDFVNWVCGPRLQPEFLLYVFRGMKPELSRLAMGSTHQTIYMPDVGCFMCALPPREEQARIVDFIRAQTAKLDSLISRIREAIAKLREYRTALISAAVTGKIDVRRKVDSQS